MIDVDNIPHILKYMGGKREMLDDIHRAIDLMDVVSNSFCDLFAGTAIVSYAMFDEYDIVSNDIQQYSEIFAKCYMNDYRDIGDAEEVIAPIVAKVNEQLLADVDWPLETSMHYYEGMSYEEMRDVETKEQELIKRDNITGFSLFKRCYSGTYWSYEQCRYIDAIREVCEEYKGSVLYDAIMAALVYAMSYSTQSTGHFAQYRTLAERNYQDILQYRVKNIMTMFTRKLEELLTNRVEVPRHMLRTSTLEFEDCVATLEPGTIVYADPPYSSVHYSRFYHVLETLVRYDNPRLEYKGRYRENRYQSPFDQRSNVKAAFRRLFRGVDQQRCHLLLSYSDNAMVKLDELRTIAAEIFGDRYILSYYSKEYQHMKMGRSDEARLNVHEVILAYKRIR